jgi:hypothetical protein
MAASRKQVSNPARSTSKDNQFSPNEGGYKMNNGINFFGMLTILFIGLKLTGHIQWSWAVVLCPLWIPVVVVSVVAFIWFLLTVVRR